MANEKKPSRYDELLKKITLLEEQLKEKEKTQKVETEEFEVPFNKFFKVMSLTRNKLTLSTEPRGRGRIYNFARFGEIQNIVYDDLSAIVNSNKRFACEGKFLIMDEKIVELHGLTKYYEQFLSKDKILNILDLDSSDIEILYKKTTKHIQETIVALLIERIIKDEPVDLNKVKVISDIYGSDIFALAKEAKERQKR